VNEALLDAPETINEDPYGAWLITVGDISQYDELLNAEEYEAFCAKEE
jgi:glycine cleavage system H protein